MTGIFLLLFLCSAKDGCHWTKIAEGPSAEACSREWQTIAAQWLSENEQFKMIRDPWSDQMQRCVKASGERGA